jgi:hypothetical protein
LANPPPALEGKTDDESEDLLNSPGVLVAPTAAHPEVALSR